MGIRISCKDASRLISRLQDGDVTLSERLRIRLHLLVCDACARYRQQVRFLRAALRNYR